MALSVASVSLAQPHTTPGVLSDGSLSTNCDRHVIAVSPWYQAVRGLCTRLSAIGRSRP